MFFALCEPSIYIIRPTPCNHHIMTNSNSLPQVWVLFPEFLHPSSNYLVGEIIGFGAYSVVCSAIDKRTGEEVAVKKIFDWQANPNEKIRTIREIDVMNQFSSSKNVS